MKKPLAYVALYLVAAWITTGVYHSNKTAQCRTMEPVGSEAERCYRHAWGDSLFVGAYWPVYWFVRSSHEAFS